MIMVEAVKYFVLSVASVVTASYFVAPLLTAARMYKRGSYSEVPTVCKGDQALLHSVLCHS